MHENTRLLFRKYARSYFHPGMKVLEVGPDRHFLLRALASGEGVEWETIDIHARTGVTHTASDEYSFPLPDGTYDIVLATNVLEHVRRIWVWIHELTRVCKPGGHVIIISPTSWPYHAYPIDCWRAYPDGMRALYEEAGLEVLVATCEALEDAHLRRSIPGRSQASVKRESGRRLRLLTRVLTLVGYPVEQAFDVVAIGRKPCVEP